MLILLIHGGRTLNQPRHCSNGFRKKTHNTTLSQKPDIRYYVS